MAISAAVGPAGAVDLLADMALSTDVGAGFGALMLAGLSLSGGKVGGAACFTKLFAMACLICVRRVVLRGIP
jgi:hypothetical protein